VRGKRIAFSVPLTRPFGPPSPFRRGIRPKLLSKLVECVENQEAI
jgi:hypothetical protein